MEPLGGGVGALWHSSSVEDWSVKGFRFVFKGLGFIWDGQLAGSGWVPPKELS